MGLRDQNYGKKIGINGSRIYHVTTLIYYILEVTCDHEILIKDSIALKGPSLSSPVSSTEGVVYEAVQKYYLWPFFSCNWF